MSGTHTFQYYYSKQSKECRFDSVVYFRNKHQIFPHMVNSLTISLGWRMEVPVAELNPSCAGPSGMGISLFLIYGPVCHSSPQDQGPAAMPQFNLSCFFSQFHCAVKIPVASSGCLTFSLCILNSIWSCQIRGPKWMPNPTSPCAVQVSLPLKSHHEARDRKFEPFGLAQPFSISSGWSNLKG